MKNFRQEVGAKGEREACDYLLGLGHTILERNWRTSHREVDIITFNAGILHFVEVKSRTAPCTAEPVENVNAAKMGNLMKAASSYASRLKGFPPDFEMSFDIVSVVFYPDRFELEYFPSAFIPVIDGNSKKFY